MRAQTRTAVAAALTAAVAFFGIAPTASANEIVVEPAPAAADEQRLPDADGDGLPDEWETNGVVLRDGTEIPLPDWGADPHRPDLFLQLNWMEDGNGRSFAPSAAILQDLVDLFDAHGIALHIDAGDVYTNIPNYGKTFGGETLAYTQNYFEGQVPAARLLNDIDQRLGERQNIFRVGVIGDNTERGSLAVGTALVSDNAFYVAAGKLETQEQLRNAILHELGHTLGLRHSGAREATGTVHTSTPVNPDYRSVMNYQYLTSTFNYSEKPYTVTGAEGPVEVPADWDALQLRTQRLGHAAQSVGARASSHGAVAEEKKPQRIDAPKATPEAPTTTTTTPAVAETTTTVNINAVLGPVLALLAVAGIGAAGVYALNALGVLK